jgi:hypothetical protein
VSKRELKHAQLEADGTHVVGTGYSSDTFVEYFKLVCDDPGSETLPPLPILHAPTCTPK